jgi:hypothetical protein
VVCWRVGNASERRGFEIVLRHWVSDNFGALGGRNTKTEGLGDLVLHTKLEAAFIRDNFAEFSMH